MNAAASTSPWLPVEYVTHVEQALRSLARVGLLADVPWQLLALNATAYLDAYLPPARYRVMLEAALERSINAQQAWRTIAGTPPHLRDLETLVDQQSSRPVLYQWIFAHALRSSHPAALLVAQHACEMAEVVAPSLVGAALRFGLMLPAQHESITSGIVQAPVAPDLLDILCRSWLDGRMAAARFIDLLLLLHAAQRARELVTLTFDAPLGYVARIIVAVPRATREPRRLAVPSPCALVERIAALGQPEAQLVVEAGLVEAESLAGPRQMLLLAALDRVVAQLERQPRRANLPLRSVMP